ncbi:S8 family peptidase [Clavibacter phaseoli]|uniref:S8 family peptidase n=1 Tax=Clavibacter phaseoli TaxID=1734031 RepID=UPI002B27726F|nr:S8 family peptidase [Clavibacter phaseoli]
MPAPHGGPPPGPAYDFEEAIQRLAPDVIETTTALEALPPDACPDNEAVAVVTLHPQSLAKSYHPKRLLEQYNLRQIGSRPVEVLPQKWTRQGEPEISHSTEIYVAGDRNSFQRWAEDFSTAPLRIHEAIQRVETVRAPSSAERLRKLDAAERVEEALLVEILLHAAATDRYIVEGFTEYANTLGIDAKVKRRLFAGGLCFIPAQATSEQLEKLALFSFLRIARPLSRLRGVAAVERSSPMPGLPLAPLPAAEVVDDDIRVAVFDGGLPLSSPLMPWVNRIELPEIGSAVTQLEQHGHDVSSAVLFGSLTPGDTAPSPFTRIDHYRVLDDQAHQDPFDLYDVLQRIDSVLSEKKYDFANLSIGPYMTVEDDDVHPWTAVLDTHLSTGQTLVSIAAGNNGESLDETDRRIQVPSDCVNGLAVGAADSARDDWRRAAYSALGPGRAPGFVKPDALEFGGSPTEPFMVTDLQAPSGVAATMGTSFAAPSALRRGIALRAHFGERLTPLGIKALLIHTAGDRGHSRAEVGWGRIPPDLQQIMTCSDGQVRIIYQGTLTPAQYLRAQIPLPADQLQGNVKVKATFTFATETDPEDPGNYSRAGLDITFRPHDQVFATEEAIDPKSGSFFRRSAFDTEGALRRDAQLWETTLNNSRSMRGSSLRNPVFDVHYNARANGGNAQSARAVPYALVVSVESRRTVDLYDRVLRAFAGRLEALQPIIDLPVRV